ncbi:transcription initiation factor TFIID subunit 9B [Kwoniella heveanensis BCC8398]|uniref:Transcription initiation factor TFIID subunit 9B n=1 Tax=Kwoniella heveanensis BCC8398 TaxID=1296120 RepID=A0A1B9GYX5_9TREE|nr:transcription initiation factor TFIID subunit 9B [Kwoniella heveanensis BCC8398]
MTAPVRPFPRDGRLISLILASKGIEDADERVVHQLLDFAHRYTADVLTSAQSLADHAARGTGSGSGGASSSANKIEKEDVELAIQMRKRYEFFEAPPRDYLATLAHELNSQPLPILPESFDIVRLPPAHQRLGEVNFSIVPEDDLDLDAFTDGDGEADGLGEDDDDDGSEVDEAEGRDDDQQREPERVNGDREQDGDGSGEDEDMEEVGIEPEPAAAVAEQVPPPVRQERDIDEDYDI